MWQTVCTQGRLGRRSWAGARGDQFDEPDGHPSAEGREEGRLPFEKIQWYLETLHQLHLSGGELVAVVQRTAVRAKKDRGKDSGPNPCQSRGACG